MPQITATPSERLMGRLRRPTLVAAALLASGCSLAPPPSTPAPVAELPEAFEEATAVGKHDATEWWKAFEDPVLDEVVDSVMAANLDLAQAVGAGATGRVRKRALPRAALVPIVQARGTVSDQSNPTNVGFGQQLRDLAGDEGDGTGFFQFPDRLGLTTYSLGAELAYELDFWGKARNESKAAGMEYLASESDFHVARIGVLSETIATYFEIADLRSRTALARETIDILLERAELTEARYDRGLVTSFELYQVRQELRNIQAGLPQLESQLVGAEGRLAILLGGFRSKLRAVLPDSLAPVSPTISVASGVPADLLLQRPDVRAAGQRLEAARYVIGARRAELLPSLSLSGTIGVQAADAGGLFSVDQWFRNLVGNLVAPIFMGGRIRNNIALAHARYNQAAAAYGRAVITAVHEVESALAVLDNEVRRHDLLESQRQQALASVALQSRRYFSGVGGYMDYLDASRALLNVESALAGALRDLALARLGVHRALGGEWVAPPEPTSDLGTVPVAGSSGTQPTPRREGTNR